MINKSLKTEVVFLGNVLLTETRSLRLLQAAQMGGDHSVSMSIGLQIYFDVGLYISFLVV